MKIPKQTIRSMKLLVSHPYAGLQITPMLGDFVDQFRMINKSLYENGIITEDAYISNHAISANLLRGENRKYLIEIMNIVNYHLES